MARKRRSVEDMLRDEGPATLVAGPLVRPGAGITYVCRPHKGQN